MAAMTDEDVKAKLQGFEGWSQEGDAIEKQFQFEDFSGSVDFVNRLTPLAEELNHHPDLSISWSKVSVSITTHSEGGLTAGDFELARRIDALGG